MYRLSTILFLEFASLLKDRLSDRFSAQVNYIPSTSVKRKIRNDNERGCYIDNNPNTKISRNRISNCNNTIYNYGSSYPSSTSLPCDDAEYDEDDPYRNGSVDRVPKGIS